MDWAQEQAHRLVDLEHRLRFAVQPEPLGYGHAVWCARDFVAGRPSCSYWEIICMCRPNRGDAPAR